MSTPTPQRDFIVDDDMVSCVSDFDDFQSCIGEEIAENVHLDAPIGIDTAECGPAQCGGPGVCSPKVFDLLDLLNLRFPFHRRPML